MYYRIVRLSGQFYAKALILYNGKKVIFAHLWTMGRLFYCVMILREWHISWMCLWMKYKL